MPKVRIIKCPHVHMETGVGYGYPVEEWKAIYEQEMKTYKARGSMVEAIEEHQKR